MKKKVRIPMPPIRPAMEHSINAIRKCREDWTGRSFQVLEVGCGVQSFIGSHLRRNGAPIVLHGLDADRYALDNRQVDKVFIAPVEKMPFPDGAYRVVIAQYLLEHLNDHRTALREILRVLEPSGMLVLVFPNPGSPEALITRITPLPFHVWFRRAIQKRKDACNHTFHTTFSFGSVKDVVSGLKESGFSSIEVSFFAETYYRFRFWRTLGLMALLYSKVLTALKLKRCMSSVVIVARREDLSS